MSFLENFEYYLKNNISEYIDIDDAIEEIAGARSHFRNQTLKLETKKKDIAKDIIPLKLGVVGGFSTGKSSFINSLIGEELLGVKVEPATAKITQLVYGEEISIKRILKNGDVENIDLKEYDKYSVHDYKDKEHGGKIEDLDYFQIAVNNTFLQKVNIIDTPGFSSKSHEDDLLTKKWIDKLDVLVWLFDAQKVGDKEESDLLNKYSNKYIIGVINKIDSKSPSKRDKILNEMNSLFDFKESSFYSAKKILNGIKSNKNKNQKIGDLVELISNRCDNNENFTIDVSNDEIVINLDGIIQKEPRVKGGIRDSYQEYKEYKENIENILSEIKNNNYKIQIAKYYEDENKLQFQLDTYLGSLSNNLQNLILDFKKNSEYLEKQLDLAKEQIEQRSSELYKFFYQNLFDKLFKHLLKEGENEEKFKRITSTIIHNEFNNFSNNVIDDYFKILKRIDGVSIDADSMFGKNGQTDLSFYIDGLIDSSIDAIIGLSLVDMSFQEIDSQKYIIDLVIPDEQLNSFLLAEINSDLFFIRKKVNIYNEIVEDLEEAKSHLKSIKNKETNLESQLV